MTLNNIYCDSCGKTFKELKGKTKIMRGISCIVCNYLHYVCQECFNNEPYTCKHCLKQAKKIINRAKDAII